MTVVLCGSLGSTAAMWEPQSPVLADAVIVEHPGHGAAPLIARTDIDALASRALEAAHGKLSLVGLSLGGAVALRAAALAPERVERLVVACTAPRFGPPEQWYERARTVREQGLASIVDAVMQRWFTPGFDVTPWREMFLSVDAEGYARCCEGLAGWDAHGDLARIAAPTLVIAGSVDPTAPPPEAGAIADGIVGARLEVIDGAAHLANVQRAGEFNRLLEEHL
jgi:3-oxoadipate enol-lactonase